MAVLAPKARLGNTDDTQSFFQRLKRGLKQFRRPTLFLLLVGSSLIQASHAFYYGFGTIIWEAQGFSSNYISILWVIGVLGEILLLMFADKLPKQITPQLLLLMGAVGALIRWSIYGFYPDAVSVFWLQNLHLFTFAATFVGTIQIVHRDVDRQDKAIVLSLIASLTGALTGITGISSGFLYDAVKGQGYWLMSCLGLLACIFACLLIYRISTRPVR